MNINNIAFQGTKRPLNNTKQNRQFDAAFKEACKDIFMDPTNKEMQRMAHEKLHCLPPMGYKDMVGFFKGYFQKPEQKHLQ